MKCELKWIINNHKLPFKRLTMFEIIVISIISLLITTLVLIKNYRLIFDIRIYLISITIIAIMYLFIAYMECKKIKSNKMEMN